MDDESKMKEWMYDFAWRGHDMAQQTNDRLDTKAMNIINFSSLLIPIITGILLYFMDKPFFPDMRLLWLISLSFLFLSILFAFKAMWLRDQGMINVKKHFYQCLQDSEFETILDKTAYDIAKWQKLILDAGKKKVKCLIISSFSFIIALFIIAASLLYLFY